MQVLVLCKLCCTFKRFCSVAKFRRMFLIVVCCLNPLQSMLWWKMERYARASLRMFPGDLLIEF
jgi:hypothetical protein